jgi:hypothetical protein
MVEGVSRATSVQVPALAAPELYRIALPPMGVRLTLLPSDIGPIGGWKFARARMLTILLGGWCANADHFAWGLVREC